MTGCSYVVFEMVANPHKNWDFGGKLIILSWKFPDPFPSASGSWNLIKDEPYFCGFVKGKYEKGKLCYDHSEGVVC